MSISFKIDIKHWIWFDSYIYLYYLFILSNIFSN